MMLKDRIVVITGSTHGYGYAVAEAMLRAGATVVVSGRSKEKLQKAVRSLSKLGPVKGKICDVRRESLVYALARFTMKTYGRIDVWINNAGYASAAGLMLETPPAQAVDMFLTNDMGTLYGTQAAMHFMAPRQSGTPERWSICTAMAHSCARPLRPDFTAQPKPGLHHSRAHWPGRLGTAALESSVSAPA